MLPNTYVQITETVTIPLAELHFQFSRSSGPGGQHVNRTASQVELTFDVLGSPNLNEAQRARVLSKLKSYIDTRGILHLTAQTTRSQYRNRAEVIDILVKHTRLKDKALYERTRWDYPDPNGVILKDSLRDQQDWHAQQGSVPKKADIDAIVDEQYVRRAVQKLGVHK